jgi:cell division protein FtsB
MKEPCDYHDYYHCSCKECQIKSLKTENKQLKEELEKLKNNTIRVDGDMLDALASNGLPW